MSKNKAGSENDEQKTDGGKAGRNQRTEQYGAMTQ